MGIMNMNKYVIEAAAYLSKRSGKDRSQMPANKNGRLLQQEEYCNLKKTPRVEVPDFVLNI